MVLCLQKTGAMNHYPGRKAFGCTKVEISCINTKVFFIIVYRNCKSRFLFASIKSKITLNAI